MPLMVRRHSLAEQPFRPKRLFFFMYFSKLICCVCFLIVTCHCMTRASGRWSCESTSFGPTVAYDCENYSQK